MTLRVAVVGSGPSGMYAADALAGNGALVDVYDRLPVPFGLVRYGVAPDHVSIRSVRDTLDKVLDRPEVRFVGNVDVGGDVALAELQACYDAVILSYGASRDRSLGIDGEDLDGSVAATDFVAWYCGHPDADRVLFERLVPTTTAAVVVGVGNVAVDVTRVLAKTAAELDQTDMPQHVLDTLAGSHVTDVHVLGRRGPAQAAFTTKELRELGELADADVIVDPAGLEFDEASEQAIAGDRAIARNVDVIREWAERVPSGRSRRIHLHFLARPVALQGDGRVERVVVERTALDGRGGATGTGATFTVAANLVVRSVGYRGVPLDGLPFADGVVPSIDGRVVDAGVPIPGLYVAGWIKRGPTGIIGTNKKDAVATVASLMADAEAGVLPVPSVDPATLLTGRTTVSTEGWRSIDAAEQALGAERGRPRTTIHDRDDLLRRASGG